MQTRGQFLSIDADNDDDNDATQVMMVDSINNTQMLMDYEKLN